MDREIVLLRVGRGMRLLKSTKPSDSAEVMVPKLGKALRKPGISKQAVFRGRTPERIFAYSVLPRDVTKIVREAADGTRTVGRVVGGKFRAE